MLQSDFSGLKEEGNGWGEGDLGKGGQIYGSGIKLDFYW